MDGSQKKKSFDAVVAVINMAAMGAGIAAAVIAASKSKAAGADADRIEKSIGELNEKFDRISEQLKGMQLEVGTATKQAEKKPESAASKAAAGRHLREKVVRVFLLQLGYRNNTGHTSRSDALNSIVGIRVSQNKRICRASRMFPFLSISTMPKLFLIHLNHAKIV